MYIGVSRVTSKGQVTIPEAIRRKSGITAGTNLIFVNLNEGILVKKSDELKGMFGVFEKKAQQLGLTRKKLAKEMEEEEKRTLGKYFR